MPTHHPGLSSWTLGAALCVEWASAVAAHACATVFVSSPSVLEAASFDSGANAALSREAARLATEGQLWWPSARGERTAAAGRAGGERALLQLALPCLKTVLERSRFGVSDQEAAAWLVSSRRSGGELDCRLWPPIAQRGEARWSGPAPRGVVAQVHSHPTRAASGRKWTPRPSQNDCRTARRLGVPVLTVSLEGVYECRPADGAIVPHLGAGWEQRSAASLADGVARSEEQGEAPGLVTSAGQSQRRG